MINTSQSHSLSVLLAASLSMPVVAGAEAAQPADLIVTGGPIYTVDVTRPIAEAFAVRGGRFVFVGPARDACGSRAPPRAWSIFTAPPRIPASSTRTRICSDSAGAAERGSRRLPSYEEIVDARGRAREDHAPGAVDHGRRLGPESLAGEGISDTRGAHRAVPNNPVILDRVDGHAVLANAAAMSAAGITAKTPDPAAGASP